MAGGTLTFKRGDTAPAFRAQCRGKVYDNDGNQIGTPGIDGLTPVNLTGATAKLLMRNASMALSLTLNIETGTAGWVNRSWSPSDLSVAGAYQTEVEVTYADSTKQTFPGSGYALINVGADLG